MATSVLIPWRDGCRHRRAALQWVLRRYVVEHPDWSVELAYCDEGPWRKAAAIMPAVARASGDVIVVADADVWATALGDAVEAVQRGASWAVPYRHLHRLTSQATMDVYAGERPKWTFTEERPYLGVAGGGIVVGQREELLNVPMDPRFEGWGGEDAAWGIALASQLGKPWRPRGIEHRLLHLWHPPQERTERLSNGSPENEALLARYRAAAKHPKRMRELLQEVPRGTTEAHPHQESQPRQAA